MNKEQINTYGVQSFISNHTLPEKKADDLLKQHFEKFFIVRVEQLLQTMNLPVPPTRATSHTIIYLTEGEAIMDIGSQTFTIYPDECLIVPAGQVFSFSKHDINKGYLCNFHNDFIIGKYGSPELLKDFEFLTLWGNPKIRFDKQAAEFVCHLLDRIFLESETNGAVFQGIIQPCFIALLAEVNRAYQPASNSTQTNAVNITNRFKELLFSSIKYKHLVSEYASDLHISANHLNKTVKAITGKSPTKWIDEAIILEAKVLLHQTSLSMSDIASEIGLTDPSYFSRLFKKHAGITPLEFRKMTEIP